MKKRTVALLCAAVALLGVIFGGTMAWLNRGTDAVVNTFTTASVGLALKETTGPYIMAPGAVLDKDPKVMVYADSASCYLFVVVDQVNFGGEPIIWEPAPGWEKVDGLEKQTVYYRVFDEDNPGVECTNEKVIVDGKEVEKDVYVYPFLKEDQVTVSDKLTKDYMSGLKEAGEGGYPKLEFTAYAIQQDYLKNSDGEQITDAVQAWALLSKKIASDATET